MCSTICLFFLQNQPKYKEQQTNLFNHKSIHWNILSLKIKEKENISMFLINMLVLKSYYIWDTGVCYTNTYILIFLLWNLCEFK